MCNSHDVEDEYHFLMNCSAYNNFCDLYLPHLSNLHKNSILFNRLMNANEQIAQHLARYIYIFLTNIMITYFFHSCASCSYALKYFCNVELMALYAILAGNDVTSFNITPI